jgi:hypothetical protein
VFAIVSNAKMESIVINANAKIKNVIVRGTND